MLDGKLFYSLKTQVDNSKCLTVKGHIEKIPFAS